MSVIVDNTTGAPLAVDAFNAGRMTLRNSAGNSLSRVPGTVFDTTVEAVVPMGGINDNVTRAIRVDRAGSIGISTNQVIFSDQFEGATLNANKWTTSAVTMVAAQTTAIGLTINSGASITLGHGYLLKSLISIGKLTRNPLQSRFRFRMEHFTNALMEIGIGDTTSSTVNNTNGYYLQRTTAGTLQFVWTYNNVNTTSTAITGLLDTNYYTADIIIDDDSATLIIQDTATDTIVAERTIVLTSTSPKQFAATRLFAFSRLYQAVAPATAPKIHIAFFDVFSLDNNANKPSSHIASILGLGSLFVPATGLPTITWTNSAFPASATLSNTAAGYTTLGGLFQFAAVAGATTDFALFGFTVPAPFNFHCTGIDISSWNTGAAVATTPSLLMWGIGVNQSAVSLATANIARLGVGVQSFPIGAVIGAVAENISIVFNEPKITNGGRFMTVILRLPVGTATVSQIIQGMVNVHGYFE